MFVSEKSMQITISKVGKFNHAFLPEGVQIELLPYLVSQLAPLVLSNVYVCMYVANSALDKGMCPSLR